MVYSDREKGLFIPILWCSDILIRLTSKAKHVMHES